MGLLLLRLVSDIFFSLAIDSLQILGTSILSDALGEPSLIPAPCFSIPLPSLPPDVNTSERDSDSHRMDEDNATSSKDQEKAKQEIQRIRLEQKFLVQRAS